MTDSPGVRSSQIKQEFSPLRARHIDMHQSNSYDALEEKLGRLAKKPGVRASIILDRISGAVLKTNGDLSALCTAKARDAATAASFSNEAPIAEASESKGVQDFSALIWTYVNMSGHLVQEADKEVIIVIQNQFPLLGLLLLLFLFFGLPFQADHLGRMNCVCYDCERRSTRLSSCLTQNTFLLWCTIRHQLRAGW